MRDPVKIGTTGYRDEIYVVYASGNAAGQAYTGLTYNATGLAANYYRNTATGVVTITLNSGTLGVYTSGGGGFVEVGNGVYQVGIPNGAFASGADNVIVNYFGASNMLASPIRYSLYRTFDVNIIGVGGSDILTTGVIDANLVSINGSGIAVASGINTTVTAISTGVKNQIASGVWEVPARTITLLEANSVDSNSIGDDAFRPGILQLSSITVGSFAPGAITSGALAVSAIGKIASGVWNDLHSGYSTSGTFGNILDRSISLVTASGGSGATAQQVWEYATRSLTVTGLADIRLINGSGFSTVSAVDANIISVTGTVVNQLASGNWNMAQAGFTTSGTFGNILDRQISQITASGGSGATAQQVWEYSTRTLTNIASGVLDATALASIASGVWNGTTRKLTGSQVFDNTGTWIGNISGNVTGSIGLIADGGITDGSFSVQSITAAAFADGAIGTNALEIGAIASGTMSSGMVAAIADFVWRTPQNGYTTSGNFGNILDRKISQITASGGSGATAQEVWEYATRELTAGGVSAIQLGLASSGNVSQVNTGVLNISGRLPAALIGGNIAANTQAVADNAITSAAMDTSAINEMASGIFQFSVENNINFGQLARALGALSAGLATGGGTTPIAFHAINNSGTTRLTAVVDASGNRTSMTLNLGS